MVGGSQDWVYTHSARLPFSVSPCKVRFMFGDNLLHVEGSRRIHVRVPELGRLSIKCHVVGVGIPLLFGLDALPAFGLILEFKNHVLSSSDPPWTLPLIYNSGHEFRARSVLRGVRGIAPWPYAPLPRAFIQPSPGT